MNFPARIVSIVSALIVLGAQSSLLYGGSDRYEQNVDSLTNSQSLESRNQDHWELAKASQRLPQVSAKVVFPPSRSLTSNESIRVRGSIERGRKYVTSLSVNGVPVVFDESEIEWHATVPLLPGKNQLVLAAKQRSSGRPVVLGEVLVEQQRRIYASSSGESKIALDSGHNRVLVLVSGSNTIYAADNATGYRTVFSSNDMSGTGVPLDQAAELVVDEAGNRVFVANTTTREILTVDLETGVRSFFASYSLPDEFQRDVVFSDLVIDELNNRLLIGDALNRRILTLELDSKEIAVLSDRGSPSTGSRIFRPNQMTVDYRNNRLLVVSSLGSIDAVDLASGDRSLFTDRNYPERSPPLLSPQSVGIDYEGNRLLVTDVSLRGIVAVDLDTGKQSVYYEAPNPLDAYYYYHLRSIEIDAGNNELIGLDSEDLVAINLATGMRHYVSAFRMPEDGRKAFGGQSNMVWGKEPGSIYLTDRAANAIYDLNTDTGERNILWDGSSENDANFLSIDWPYGMLFDEVQNRILLAFTRTMIQFSLDEGVMRMFSSETVPPAGGLVVFIKGIDLDRAYHRVLAVGRRAMMAADLDTGARRIVSGPDTPDTENSFGDLISVKLDEAQGRALVADLQLKTLFSVDLQTGKRSIFSASGTPDFEVEFDKPGAMVLSPAANRLVMDDKGRQQLLSIDLTTGKRTALIDYQPEGEENPIDGVEAMLLDENKSLLYVLGFQYIYLIDMKSGERVYLAH